MSALAIAAIVLVCVFGGALVGKGLRRYLPEHHLKEDSKNTVNLAIGVIATMSALVLGLMVSSAKSSFDRMADELTQAAATVVQLDRTLVEYGPEAIEIRRKLRSNYQTAADMLIAEDKSQIAKLRASNTNNRVEDVAAGIRALAPRSDEQREARARALGLVAEASANRWLLTLQQHDSISTPLLVVVVSWLALIFVGFGMFSPPHNATVVIALFLCALSVAGAIFLIIEMDDPLTGIVRISDAPMRKALAILNSD
jgi:uncharacterized membrane protein HdeD (DUF308 family)